MRFEDLDHRKLEIWALFIILAFAFFLRVYALGSAPFWIDESISTLVSQKIIEHGVPVMDSGMFYGGQIIFQYIQAFFLLFGSSEFNARIISVIFGLLTVLLAYFIGREYSKYGGLLSALFMSVFYLEIFFSRQARHYQMFQFFFFLSLYLLYKARDNSKMIYPALISAFVCVNTQIAGLFIVPFFFIHIFMNGTKLQKWLSIIPLVPLATKLFPALNLSSFNLDSAKNTVLGYYHYTSNMFYLLVLFIPGVAWAFKKNSRLTFLLIVPSTLLLIALFFVKLFALRYIYFFAFPLILFFSLLLAFLIEEYGHLMWIAVIALLIIPSTMVFPYTYVNVLSPMTYNLNDASMPYTDYKNLPDNVSLAIKSDTTLISYFSPDVEYYLRKPDYVLPFSMTGMGNDGISINNSREEYFDRYSGAPILISLPEKPYFVTADSFSLSKLRPTQKAFFENITENCSVSYSNIDLKIYSCE